MDEIAEKASVSKGTLYNQFESKEDLFRGIAEHLLKVELEQSDILLCEGEPVRQLKALYGGLVSLYGDKVGFIFEIYSIASRDPKMHDILAGVIEKEVEEFARMIARMQAEGRVRQDVDPRSMAFLLMSMCLGLMACSSLAGIPPDDALDIGLRSVLSENPGSGGP